MVYVLYIVVMENRIPKDVLYCLLSTQRRNQVLSLCQEADRVQSSLAYLLLRMALYREYKITKKPLFLFGEENKPYFKDITGIFFNLCHCKNAVLCAVGEVENGVDIQEYGDINENASEMIFHTEETAYLKSAVFPEQEKIRFLSMKEAYGKYLGKGILYDLPAVSFAKVLPDRWQQFQNAYILSTMQQTAAFSVCAKSPMTVCTVSHTEMIAFIKERYKIEGNA